MLFNLLEIFEKQELLMLCMQHFEDSHVPLTVTWISPDVAPWKLVALVHQKNCERRENDPLGFSLLRKFFYYNDFTIIYPITVSNFDVSKAVTP